MSTMHSLRTKLRRGENVCTFSRVRTQLSRKTQLPLHNVHGISTKGLEFIFHEGAKNNIEIPSTRRR